MRKYNVFESTNMGTTKYAERIFDAVSPVDIENGTFGYLNELADGEAVIYNFVPGTKNGEPVVVADNPAWDADNCRITNQRRDKYIIPAGTPFRVRVVKKNDEFGTAIEGVTPATQEVVTGTTDFTENKVFLTVDATTGKLVAATTSTDGSVMEARIMRKRIVGGTLTTPADKYGHATTIYEAKVVALV